MASVIVFDEHLRDWIVLKKFNTEAQANGFIESYPSFGAEYSRTIRGGNWQIVVDN